MSTSPDTDPLKVFGFNDLHSFKDYVGYVILCAPDMFPHDGWEPVQMNLDLAFDGLHLGLKIVSQEKGERPMLEKCRRLVERSYSDYKQRRVKEGMEKLIEMQQLVKNL